MKHIKPNNENTKIQNNSAGLQKSLEDNIKIFRGIFKNDETIVFRYFENQSNKSIKCSLFFCDGMTDKKLVSDGIIKPILLCNPKEIIPEIKIIDFLEYKIISAGNIIRTANIDEIVSSVFYGNTALIVDGSDEALVISTTNFEKRAVSEPESEKVVKGPREGFVEPLLTNISLIKRKIKNPSLKFKFRDLGVKTKTKICICYIEGIVSEKILQEVHYRLDKIQIDGVLDSGYIEEFIKDSPLSPFHTTGSTERPDVVAGKLLEGRIAIICDGSPFVITIPYLFLEYFQTNEDYYREFIFASFNRLLRMFGFMLTISIPAVYIAISTFHQEVLQTPLLLSISAAREEVPFPTVVEALLMVFVFEVLREAGIRLPTPIGQAISIVGALVLGEAAVTARFISAPMVIVIALTGITSFLIPKIVGPAIIMRLIFIILSSVLGLYGYIFGLIGLFIHLMSVRSFGIPYMMGEGTLNKIDIQDTAVRAPWWMMKYRPALIGSKNRIRQLFSK